MTSKTKGYIGSFAVHFAIVALLILFGFSTPLPLPGEGGILINFGDNDEGSGLLEPRPSPREEVQAVEHTPVEQEETPITQDFEEAPSIPAPKPNPKPEKVEEKKPVEEVKPVEEKPREIDRKTLFPGKKPDGGTAGEGVTGNKGNQGNPSGSTDSQSRVGGTTAGGEGISFSLDGRAPLSLPKPEYSIQKSGSVVVQVTVDRDGNVTKVIGGFKGSTTYDNELIRVAEAAARKARFDVKQNAPAYQTGTITYVFKLQ